jgi:hypothetical protein
MTNEGRNLGPAADQVAAKLQALYETLSPDERDILDFILRQAAQRVAEQADAAGYAGTIAAPQPGSTDGSLHAPAGTQDAMKKVLFGAAGVTGGLMTPGVINWLVASARDANLFS